MQLYSGSAKQFVFDTIQNQVADKMRNAWFGYYRYYPPPSEVSAWRNSLRAMGQVVQYAGLDDHGLILEYNLPMTSRRIDCLITGKDESGQGNAVIVELKQWERCDRAEGDRVVTWIGGGHREMLHPSVQCDSYRQYLQDCHTAFYEQDAIGLRSCSYLHNYSIFPGDPLLDAKFQEVLERTPVFSQNDVDPLRDFLLRALARGQGLEILQRVQGSRYRPSKKLMDHVGRVIKGQSDYVLLDEQLLVYDKILTILKKGYHTSQKHVVVVRGGPGTGKSVIAINLMGDLLSAGFNVQYATGSRAFTETLRRRIGSRGSDLFRYFNSYMRADPEVLDVLLMDEAHRIRKTSANRFTRKESRSGKAQLEELLNASRVGVFFIDDDQVVRPDEIGSSAYILEGAKAAGAILHEFTLEAQFRCAGSDGFVNWINNTLGIRPTANVLWERDERFDFRIMDSPQEVEDAIRARVAEGFTGRMMAGYCWEWSRARPDGTLRDDVVIGDYRRPWNAMPESKHLAAGIPKASVWATEPGGINQVGCIYTAQGFEFDYAGVIFGRDLYFDPREGVWKGRPEQSFDTPVRRSRGDFVQLVKNTYRVLLSRGIRGCYVNFIDEDTRNFFRSRMATG